ncbi:MAG: cytochrome c-type biogenesis protein CcmH, partial [Candidatus Binatia bacterium]
SLIALLIFPMALQARPVDPEEQARRIAADLRCPVCQNLSVADSPSEMAQQMRALIREQLKEGKSPQEIKAYFTSKYGEWVLLAPTTEGFNLLVWILPFIALTGGILFVILVARRWVQKKSGYRPSEVDPALIQRVQQDIAADKVWEADPEIEGPRAQLLYEQARHYTEIKELEFDYQAGRLSESDYQDLRPSYEAQAANVLRELDSSPAEAMSEKRPHRAERQAKDAGPAQNGKAPSRRVWIFGATGAFLLVFGVTLGIFLSKSLRPRGSEQDSITGDFLTGTTPQVTDEINEKNLQNSLAQGRSAMERQDWPQAIEAFKKALAIKPDLPEAHAYMGIILTQAGHADGALLAFNRALSTNPEFPLALWGKGMVLYRDKGDLSGARENLQKLVSLLPSGAERDEVQRTIDGMGSRPAAPVQSKQLVAGSSRIEGTISVDPKLKAKLNSRDALYIIVRSAGSAGGPPLAVKKVGRPVFPLSYSLGPENMMIPGRPFSGKVNVYVRLDKDGNAMTRDPGSLKGDYKKNPVEIGSQRVDIIIDQVL